MSIRPPTLREKRRYLLARIDPAGTSIEPKDLYYAVYEAVVSLFGDVAAAAMQPSVLAVENGICDPALPQGSRTRVCHRPLDALPPAGTATVAIRVLAVSGTIESLRERIATIMPQDAAMPPGRRAGRCRKEPTPITCGYRFDSIAGRCCRMERSEG